jgi:hypothetical protein
MKTKNLLLICGSTAVIILLITVLFLNALSYRYLKLDHGLVLDKWTKSVYDGPQLVYRLKSK